MEERKLRRKKEKALEERNQENLAVACNNLGDFYNQHGSYQNAVQEYLEESKIYSKLGRRLEMAKAYRMVAEMYMLLSEFEKALKHVNIYLKIAKELGNKIETQRAYATLGRAYLLQGQSAIDLSSGMRPLKNAEKAFIQSLLISKELSGTVNKLEILDMQTRLYLNIGVVKEHMEDFEESISYKEKAIKLSKTNDLFELLHLCYISISLLYFAKVDNTTLALRFCNLALDVSERLPNRSKKECEALIIKSEIMIKLGDFQSAKQVLHKAYKIKSPDLNDRETIEKNLKVVAALCYTLDSLITTNSDDYKTKKILYEKMGDGCCILLNYTKAIDYYLKMLDCAEKCCESNKELASIYISLYQTYKDNKQYDLAVEYLWKEFDVNKDEPVEAFSTLCNIGEVCELLMKPYWTIQDVYVRAINIAQEIQNDRLEKIGLVRLKKLQEKFGMHTLLDNLREDASKRGIDLSIIDDDSDSEAPASEHNTPDIGDDICLDDLTDSDNEVKDEPDQLRSKRKRGVALTIKRNNKGETQLHQACIAGNLELARRLIDQGHTVNVRDHAGWLPLHEACNHGYHEIVQLLLDNGAVAAINDKGGTGCDGITPLYDACSNGYLEVIHLLLERGANATLKTDFGDNCVNILDKWRNSVDLDLSEQALYENVRSKLVDQLSRAGMIQNTNIMRSPLTNKSCTRMDKNDLSLDKLRNLAYGSDSGSSEEEYQSSGYKTRSLSRSSLNKSKSPANSSSFKVLQENNTSGEKSRSNVKFEYKNVMESLKHPNRLFVDANISNENIKQKRSGYLDPDEVDDDWLDEDIKPDRKKIKYSSVLDRKERRESHLSDSLPARFTKENPLNDDEESQDAFQVLLSNKGTSKSPQKMKLPRSASLTGNSSRHKYQSSLLDSGFCRFRSESPLSIEDDVGSTEPDSTTTSNYITRIESTQTSTILPAPTVSFKIKVEDELLLIPVDRKKISEVNIRWLAEEASRRYYNLIGLKPVLRLMTSDGFAYEENDLISAAVDESMISSKVLEWKISPLYQRYEEMCIQLQLDVDLSVKSTLEKSQSNCLLLNDNALTPDLTLPIFKALLHQTALRSLDLSNNFIQDEGCKQLSKSLVTLKQLKTLNLQGNCITSEGISTLTSAALTELEELCLSYNPLSDKSIRCLEIICNNAPKLKKLQLSTCHITNFYNFDLRFFDLIDFDISFNSLTSLSFKSMLGKLNTCRLQILNLSFCTSDSQSGIKLVEFLESGTCEKFKCLDFSGCQLTDADVYNLVQYLSKASDLEMFSLAENPKLTTLAFQYILEYISHTKKLFLQQCLQIVNVSQWKTMHFNSKEKFPELIVMSVNKDNCYEDEDLLRNFWNTQYGEKAKINVYENQITLYVNESDLI